MDESQIEASEAQIEREKEARIKAAQAAPPDAAYTGACLFCAEPLAPPRRWCDADCRGDWEREQKSRPTARPA